MKNKRAWVIGFLWAAGLMSGGFAVAQTTTTYQVGVGPTHVLDTYLSQEKFKGTGITVLTTSEHARSNRQWATLQEHEVNFSLVNDRSGRREEMQGDYTLLAGRLRSWQLGRQWTVQAGGMAAVNVGFIYNTANSNNPAQARLSLNVMPTATVQKRLQVFRRAAALRYEVNLPLAGLMFSPNYGQSYYEIFSLGNYDHNVVPVTPFSAPTLRHQLTASYSVTRNLTLSVGYLGHYQQAEVNHLKSHVYQHRVAIGIVRRFSLNSLPAISN